MSNKGASRIRKGRVQAAHPDDAIGEWENLVSQFSGAHRCLWWGGPYPDIYDYDQTIAALEFRPYHGFELEFAAWDGHGYMRGSGEIIRPAWCFV